MCAGCESENPGRSSKLICTGLAFPITGNSGCDRQNLANFSSSSICLESVSSDRICPSILPTIIQKYFNFIDYCFIFVYNLSHIIQNCIIKIQRTIDNNNILYEIYIYMYMYVYAYIHMPTEIVNILFGCIMPVLFALVI